MSPYFPHKNLSETVVRVYIGLMLMKEALHGKDGIV
jgi:hypothetical protein